MRILLQTRFHPSVGGIETLALVLCREWRTMGHIVTVSTDVAAAADRSSFPYPVHHQPGRKLLANLCRSHDVVVMMNVSLKTILSFALSQTPIVLTHHTPYWSDREGTRDWRERLKVAITRRHHWNLCVSQFIAEAVQAQNSVVVPNCYDEHVFHRKGSDVRDRDIVFVGRLVSDKGADLLLDAVSRLPEPGARSVTLIGDGPERDRLERRARELGLRVRFTGSLAPEAVASKLRRHKVMAVPSLWREPFGIVALEGMACGCAVVVADGGGLPEAVGDAGVVFRRGDAEDLALKLGELLKSEEKRRQMGRNAVMHLARHASRRMAGAYLDLIQAAVAKRGVASGKKS